MVDTLLGRTTRPRLYVVPPLAPMTAEPKRSRTAAPRSATAVQPVHEPGPPADPAPDVDLLDALCDAGDAGDPSRPGAYPSADAAEQQRQRDAFTQRLAAYMTRGRPRVVVTDNLHTMVSIKRGHGVFTFRLHHMFLDAPPRVLRALARYAERQDRDAAGIVRAFVDYNEPLIRARSEPRPITCDVEGRFHDLQAIFDELNARYFEGGIVARITWGPRGKRRRSRGSIKLGSYTFEDRLIRIHPVLDAQDVPRFFVEWIVYHEMLHEVHDIPVVDGRRKYHTPEFRRAEARFERYADAVLWERTHVHRLMQR